MKKGAALLIVIMLIGIFLSVAVTLTKSGIINVMITSNIASSMIAEEASQTGLEVGLLYYKLHGVEAWPRGRYVLDQGGDTCQDYSLPGCPAVTNTTPYADIRIEVTGGNAVKITSTGHYSAIVRQHTLTEEIQ